MPHDNLEKEWLHLRDAICLGDVDAIVDELYTVGITVLYTEMETQLVSLKTNMGWDACAVVDKETFKESINNLISEAIPIAQPKDAVEFRTYRDSLPDPGMWDRVFDEMVGRASGRIGEGPAAHEPGQESWREAAETAREWAINNLHHAEAGYAVTYLDALLDGTIVRRGEQYAAQGIPGTDREASIQTHMPYILNNLTTWRGEEARNAKAIFRAVQKGDLPAHFTAIEQKAHDVSHHPRDEEEFRRFRIKLKEGGRTFKAKPPGHYTKETPQGALESMEERLTREGQFTRRITQETLNSALAQMELKVGEIAEAVRLMGERGITAPVLEQIQVAEEAIEEVAEAVKLPSEGSKTGIVYAYVSSLTPTQASETGNQQVAELLSRLNPEMSTFRSGDISDFYSNYSHLEIPRLTGRGPAPIPGLTLPRAGSKARVVADYLLELGDKAATTDLDTFLEGINAANPDLATAVTEGNYYSTVRTFTGLPELSLLGRGRRASAEETPPPPALEAPRIEGGPLDDILDTLERPERMKALLPAAMDEPTSENTRRQLQQMINAGQWEREELEEVARRMGFEPNVWDTEELKRDFEVHGFLAPFAMVTRKAQHMKRMALPAGEIKGTLLFQHSPRYYWGFTPEPGSPERQAQSGGSWSQKYYPGLTPAQHDVNNAWFQGMLDLLKPDGFLGIPELQRAFNKQGEEIPWLDESEIRPNRVIENPPNQ